MSELRSVVETLRSETLTDLPDAVIEEHFCELHHAMELMEAEGLRRLAEIERRRIYERDGHLSAMAWLASRFRLAWASLGSTCTWHERSSTCPRPPGRSRKRAFDLGASGAGLCPRRRPGGVERSEQVLVEAARIHTIQELRRVVAYWAQAVQADRAATAEERMLARRRLHASPTLAGTVRVDGDLDHECGESLLTALGAVQDDWARADGGDERTPAQRRADALGEICRQWLDLAHRPPVAGERPHLTLTVGPEAIHGVAGGRCEADHVGPVSPELARRISCDASVRRMVLTGGPESLWTWDGAPRWSPQPCAGAWW